jgi:hypothetical protein
MKLQYLDDYRDAFKWDLLHWLCSTADSEATSLLFVPLLTPDDPNPRDGQIPHNRFLVRQKIQPFIASLKNTSRGLGAITDLGSLEPTKQFSVSIHAPDRYVEPGRDRPDYWWGIDHPSKRVVFLDPDNGFETKTRKGAKWVRHSEVNSLLEKLPQSSAVVVYQHRPRLLKWKTVLGDLSQHLQYAGHASATYDSSLAFMIIGNAGPAVRRLSQAAKCYANQHRSVFHELLIDNGA